jgi:hypothetical protein
LDAHEGARSGFWHNVHSNNHRGICDVMWYKDLELAALGQEYIRLPVSVVMLTQDHKALLWYANAPEICEDGKGDLRPRAVCPSHTF